MSWKIDKDFQADETRPKGTNSNAVGVCAREYKDGDKLPHQFRMLDDDRTLIYTGRSNDRESMRPLDEFGMPNMGCTIIQYRDDNGDWKDL